MDRRQRMERNYSRVMCTSNVNRYCRRNRQFECACHEIEIEWVFSEVHNWSGGECGRFLWEEELDHRHGVVGIREDVWNNWWNERRSASFDCRIHGGGGRVVPEEQNNWKYKVRWYIDHSNVLDYSNVFDRSGWEEILVKEIVPVVERWLSEKTKNRALVFVRRKSTNFVRLFELSIFRQLNTFDLFFFFTSNPFLFHSHGETFPYATCRTMSTILDSNLTIAIESTLQTALDPRKQNNTEILLFGFFSFLSYLIS